MANRLIILILVFSVLGCTAAQNRPLRLLSGQGPIYPENVQDSGIPGHVVLRYDVNPKGAVVNIRVVESHPAGVFDLAAVKTLSTWRFSAKLVDGVEQPSRDVTSKISFRLSGDSTEF